MKYSITVCLLAAALSTLPSVAAIPSQIHYQGMLTGSTAVPLDTTVAMIFRLYDGPDAGATQLWSESWPAVTCQAGLFDVLLGSVAALPQSVFAGSSVWLGITVGNNAEMTPRTSFASVAYAYRVGTVDGATGGTISGKMNMGQNNSNLGNWAFVSGYNNRASGDYSTIAGGGGGSADSNAARGDRSAIGGGGGNYIYGIGSYSVVAGGQLNQVYDHHALIGGGNNNRVRGEYSVVAGGGGSSESDSNSVLGIRSFIGGGAHNTVQSNNALIGGGYGNIAADQASIVVGGQLNRARGRFSFVGGGGGTVLGDSNSAMGDNGVITGGLRNNSSGPFVTIGGGYGNHAADSATVVAGGRENTADSVYSTIGGGLLNQIQNGGCVIGGGIRNRASGDGATIGGGGVNRAEGYCSTVGGGYYNFATGSNASVLGGYNNTAAGVDAMVGGGHYNSAYGWYSVVAGGGGFWQSDSNSAMGESSMVPGGKGNHAMGNYSFAGGHRAIADHDGAFVWADSTNADFTSSAANQFNVRSSGGVRIYTNTAATIGVTLNASDNTWNSVCDSTTKTDIRLVDTRDILNKVSTIPVKRWRFRDGNPNVEHISPMAQDFWNAFRVGSDSLKISSLDPAGIALAAIQELTKRCDALEEHNQALEAQLKSLMSGSHKEK